MGKYQQTFQEAINNPEGFWHKQANLLAWYDFPKNILTQEENGTYRWFKGGKLNTCYLAVDYHVEQGRGNQAALIYDSPVTNTKRHITFAELKEQVSHFAGVLKHLGVEKGDRVVIYMPMIPEAAVAMLACARLGAIHSVVFGGFAPHELAIRIDDAKPKVIVSASCGIEVQKVIPYKPMVDEAIKLCNHPPQATVIYKRPQVEPTLQAGRDHDWAELMSLADPVDPVIVDATDPLYILYTSGTTGKPKGVVRTNGDHAVAMKFSMNTVYNAQPGEVYWAASDVGWVVGHSYIVYAPLLQGCTSIIFEGKPVRTPDPGTFWRIMAEHKVNIFFTAPTAFRAIKKEDPDLKFKQPHDISSLKTLFLAGERLDPPTYEWLKSNLSVPVVDHWWQTETGWAIVCNPMGLEVFSPKSGSATKPTPGFQVEILDDEGNPTNPGESGSIAIKLPLPPGCLPTLWQDHERFKESYLKHYPGYYLTGDGGFIDEDGYVFVMGRIDDVINVAGHRLSTGEMEELIGAHWAVAECAVVGIHDDLKGQVPIGLVVLKDDAEIENEVMEKELVAMIRHEIGAVASFKHAVMVKRLPKTRSGKILRKTIRRMASETNVPVPATIDDPAILGEIQNTMESHKIGQYSGIK